MRKQTLAEEQAAARQDRADYHAAPSRGNQMAFAFVERAVKVPRTQFANSVAMAARRMK